MSKRSRHHAIRAALALTASIGIAALSGAQEPQERQFKEKAVACLDCHETDRVMGIAKSAHSNFEDPNTPAAQHQCQSCHGPSKVHMQFPMQVSNVHFGKSSEASPQVQNEACLACHAGDKSDDWKASAHGFENLVCSTCHHIHSPEKVVLSRVTTIETCTMSGCHTDLMGSSKQSDFTHPVGREIAGERSFICSDCHDPHGPLASGRCTDCHEQTPQALAKESEKARRFHEVARARGSKCMSCHRGLAHPLPEDVREASRPELERHAN